MVFAFRTCSATAVALLLLAGVASAETIVLRGARVLTMDAAKPEAQAVAIVDGRIAAVGSAEEMASYLAGATVYDLPAGALVLPGFRDGHNHLIWSATEAGDVSFAEATDREGVREAMEAAGVASLPPDAWIRGAGWDIAAYPDPTAAVLDEFSGGRPAYVASADGHSAWVNTVALKLAGIDANTKDPEGGRIERDARNNPTGLLRESATELVSSLMPGYTDAEVDAGLAGGQAEAHGYGLTAIIDPSTENWMLAGYSRADAAGQLTLEVAAGVKVDAKEGPAGVARVLDMQKRFAGPHLKVNAVKLYVDGVIETETAALLEAYVGSNEAGDLLFTPEQLNAVATAADKAGLQLHAHAIGDRAVRVTLDAYEAAARANGPRDGRHQITHLELVDPADLGRFRTLGVLANIQALWAYADTYIVDLTEPKIGPARSEWLYPIGALKQAGATLVGSSDWSVSSMNPLEAIQTGVTRQDIADPAARVLTPQHRVGVIDMIEAYTVNAAFASFDETESGTLTAGKQADVVVLDRDITKVASTDIAAGKVLATIADGRIVHRGEGLLEPIRP